METGRAWKARLMATAAESAGADKRGVGSAAGESAAVHILRPARRRASFQRLSVALVISALKPVTIARSLSRPSPLT